MIKNLSVVQLCPDLSGGGGLEKSAVEIAQAVIKEGGRSLILSKTLGPYEDLLRNKNIQFVQLNLSPKPLGIGFVKDILRLRKFLIQNDIDILHARSRYPAWVAYFACKHLPVKFVTTWHGRHIAKRFSPRWLYNSGLIKAEVIIAVSNWVRSEISRQFSSARTTDKIVVIERGAVPGNLKSTVAKGSALRKKWGVSPSSFLILLPGRYTPWKGGMHFIKTLGRLKTKKDWTCVLVGKCPKEKYREQMLQEIRKQGLEGKVILAGECADMAAAYKAADLVAIPNIEPEPFGRVAVEAQMAGKRVVATRTGALEETLFDKSCLVSPNDDGSFATLLDKLISAPKEDEKASDERRIWVEEHYDLKQMCKHTLDLYKNLISL